jgi:hypothetical protein
MKAEQDKERYKKEKSEFEETLNNGSNDPNVAMPSAVEEKSIDYEAELKKRKAVAVALAPRHPLSAYLFFIANNRARFRSMYPEKSFSESARLLGIFWKTLDREERRKYEILAVADRFRYEEERREWDPPPMFVQNEFKNDMDSSSRPRKPLSAYAIWAAQERAAVLQQYPDIDRKELTRILRQNWKELTDLDRMVNCFFLKF